MYIDRYMDTAFDEAMQGIEQNHGGPFGAVVVLNEEIIGRGHNRVIQSNDPTAHAEVNAIRDASANIKNFDLSGAEIYSTCEPCPMCMSAIYWARISSVYYTMDRFDAETLGFSDNHIYQEISKPHELRVVNFKQVKNNAVNTLLSTWANKPDRLSY